VVVAETTFQVEELQAHQQYQVLALIALMACQSKAHQ
jgi:hypothetical protein